MECAELIQKIQSGDFPKTLAIVGTDAYWCKIALDAITSLCDPFDLSIIDEGASLKDIVIDLGTIPLLGAYRVIIVRGYAKPLDKDKKMMESYIKEPNSTSVLVFDCKCDFSGVEVVNCDKHYGEILTIETQKIINELGKSAGKEVINRLIDYCESDMSKIYTECLKLCAYADTNITLDDLDSCVEPGITYKSYNFVNYVLAGDYVSCYDLVKKNEDKGTTIIGSLIRLFRCALYLKQRCDENSLMKIFDMKPYQMKFAKNVMRTYNAGELYGLLQLFYKLELEVKSGITTDENALVLAVSQAIERRMK